MDGLHAAFDVANTRAGDDALELVRSGVVDGFSVRFRPIRNQIARDGAFERVEAALFEVSLTPWPYYPDAQIEGVRSNLNTLNLEAELASRRLRLQLLKAAS